MVVFKKIPDNNSGSEQEGFVAASAEALNEFGAATAEVLGQFAMSYWPMVVAGMILFVLILRGFERAAIPVSIVAVLLQAWLLLGRLQQVEGF